MTATRPKGLIVTGAGMPVVANKPLLLYGLDAMRSAGIREVGIVAGNRTSSAIRALVDAGAGAGLRVWHLPGRPEAGAVEALASAADFVEDSPCVVQLRDGLVRGDMAPLLDELGRDELDALLLLDGAEPVVQNVTGLDDRRLLRLAGQSTGKPARLAGVHVLGPRVVHEAAGGGNLVELLRRVIAGGGRARARSFSGAWRAVGQHEELLEANRTVLDDLHPGPQQGNLIDSRIQGRVLLGPGVRLESSVIRGPAVIGSGVQLRHAYIGPYTSIGDDVEIEGAEVENSVILPGAVIEHLGGRLEASVIGRGARVYRDFSLPRALKLRIADDDEVCLA